MKASVSQTSSKAQGKTALRKGDLVIVIAGGHEKKRANRGHTGKILRFLGRDHQRAVVEGLNYVTRHKRATAPGKPSGKLPREAGIHVSNLMYYVESLKAPVHLRFRALADGSRVRGYLNKKGGEFVQIVDEKK
jgi:large subunit ribosomal protein L24